MTKRDREQMVEGVLKRWRKIQDEVQIVEDDAANVAFSQGSGEPVQSSSLSDKTARGALMLDGVDEKRRWVDCITDAMRWLAEEQPDLQRLIYGHYWMDCAKGYKRSHARSFAVSYCKVYHIAQSEYHNRRLDAIDEIVFYAMECGLLHSSNERRKTMLIS